MVGLSVGLLLALSAVTQAADTDPCADETGVLAASAFALVTQPDAGAIVGSGFEVRGCSRTFESSLRWRLTARDGSEIAAGVAQGGGVDGPAPFRFTIDFAVPTAQIGHLEVGEVDASDGEGNPPGRTVLPLVLRAAPPQVGPPSATSEPDAAPEGGRPPTAAEIAGATYSGIYEKPIQLKAGRYAGAPRRTVQLVTGLTATGDMDGDAVSDAAVVLSESSGGSGTRLYLAVVAVRGGEPVNVGTAFIGDRPQVRSIGIRDGWIRVDLVEQGPQDAACCPGQVATRYWGLQGGQLVQVAVDVKGRLSLDLLDGTEWKLRRFDLDDPVPAGLEITLSIAGDRIAGTSGCNRYFAQITEGTTPGEIAVGQAGSTRMACPGQVMEAESRYLTQLGQVTRYTFLAGDLALTAQAEGRVVTMLFSPR